MPFVIVIIKISCSADQQKPPKLVPYKYWWFYSK